ncbi:MAG: ANTAR domain-containing protein [Lachnospiraceae bacterium]|nr:ANTAR domain-containing protein [Lachnospiraceae bacterium]
MDIIIVFPKKENAIRIKQILQQSGYDSCFVATTGAKALETVQNLDYGIVISAFKLCDMMYGELEEYLPNTFRMLLVAPANAFEQLDYSRSSSGCLKLPFKVHELLAEVENISSEIQRYRRKLREKPKERSEEEKKLISKAKLYLMDTKKIDESAAHRYLQKRSMDNGTDMTETAQMILQLAGVS